MLPHNARMMQFLAQHGIEAMPKYIKDGSLKHSWRLYNLDRKWSQELADELNAIGFTNIFGEPLGIYSGNGGLFSVFVKGHYELLKDWEAVAVPGNPSEPVAVVSEPAQAIAEPYCPVLCW